MIASMISNKKLNAGSLDEVVVIRSTCGTSVEFVNDPLIDEVEPYTDVPFHALMSTSGVVGRARRIDSFKHILQALDIGVIATRPFLVLLLSTQLSRHLQWRTSHRQYGSSRYGSNQAKHDALESDEA